MKIETEEYPEDGKVIINEIIVNYSQESEVKDDFEDLLLSIENQGGGYYYVMKTDKWRFDNIEELVKVLEDFKLKANIK